MADPEAEARIRELKRRVTQDVTSPLFVGLAEEYRALGRLSDAIRTLEKGIQTHPHYISARVALARAYQEAGHLGDAAALFSRILAADPANLISARSLAEIALARGDRVEAIKRYRLYRALSGDRGVDEIVARIERDLAPPAPPPPEEPPRGRVLADLYMAQGHHAEALAVYEELARAEPGDTELSRLRSEAASALAAKSPAAREVAVGRDTERRRAKVQALNRWLRVIQAR